jgi:membrane protein required for colicin V production
LHVIRPDLRMNWIDWTIVALVSLSTVLSIKRGFVKESLSLLAWVVAFLVATAFSARFAAQLAVLITNDSLRYATAYVLLFAASIMLGSLFTAVLAELIKVSGLSGVDRMLGTVFGFLRGLVIVLVLLFVTRSVVPPKDQRSVEQSTLVPHLNFVEQWTRENFSDLANRGRLSWLE